MNLKHALPSIPATLHSDLFSWYSENKRDLPWRRTKDPYSILVSEVMLQQTQVSRVIEKYNEFLDRFPTLTQLAEASTADVIRAWASLGFNIRARRLHGLAIEVVHHHGGALPDNIEDLRRLPGLGPYTAAAVANFAFDIPVPVIDTNIERVLNRIGFGPIAASKHEVEALTQSWMPGKDASTWHQGIMDVGSLVCKVAKPLCKLCPFEGYCKAAPFIYGEDPQVLPQDARPIRVKQSVFKGSTRFYRGRIVKSLRSIPPETSIEYVELAVGMFDTFNVDEDLQWFQGLLAGLEKDGLIRLEGTQVTLP